MRTIYAPLFALFASSCGLNDPNTTSGGYDITSYVSGPWRSYQTYYNNTGLRKAVCIMSTLSIDSSPARAFFRSSWPQATVTTDTRSGERNKIAFHVAYEQDPKGQPVIIVGAKEFKLVVNGEFAYPPDAGAELSLLKAMKANSAFRSKAVVKGAAKDGTRTEDHFGLEGFEAQLSAMNEHCPVAGKSS